MIKADARARAARPGREVANVAEPSTPKPLLRVSEVALYLQQSEQSIYRHIRSKKLEASKVGGEWRISDEAIRKFLEDGMNVEK
jgi:excisionase family DNA binding protein